MVYWFFLPFESEEITSKNVLSNETNAFMLKKAKSQLRSSKRTLGWEKSLDYWSLSSYSDHEL